MFKNLRATAIKWLGISVLAFSSGLMISAPAQATLTLIVGTNANSTVFGDGIQYIFKDALSPIPIPSQGSYSYGGSALFGNQSEFGILQFIAVPGNPASSQSGIWWDSTSDGDEQNGAFYGDRVGTESFGSVRGQWKDSNMIASYGDDTVAMSIESEPVQRGFGMLVNYNSLDGIDPIISFFVNNVDAYDLDLRSLDFPVCGVSDDTCGGLFVGLVSDEYNINKVTFAAGIAATDLRVLPLPGTLSLVFGALAVLGFTRRHVRQ